MFKKALPACAALVLLFGNVEVFAEAKDPEAIAKEYFEDLKSSQYDKAAEFFRESDLKEFKALFIPIYEAEQKEGKKEFLTATFGGNASLDDVKAANPSRFFGILMNFVFKANPMGKPSLTKMKVIGSLKEPDANLVHVLTRNYVKMGSIETNKLEPLSFTQEGGVWKLVMPDQMKAMGQAIQKGIAMRQQHPK